MGNCQAAEAATVLIQRPGGEANNLERIYWSVSAREVMSTNPGHYVARVVVPTGEDGASVKQLKLLRPDDTLRLGQVYRLISFQDVLKEFDAKKKKKSAELGKLLNKSRSEGRVSESNSNSDSDSGMTVQQGNNRGGDGGRAVGRHSGQWKPALQTITEFTT